MADLVTGAMSSLIPKLGELLKEEYNLQTGVKERVRTLSLELEGAHAALRKVAQVPWDELDEQVKLWAREVRESSYDMEDVLDTFLVRVQGRDDSTKQKESLKHLYEKMANLFKKSKARRDISVGVKDIMSHLDEVAKRCRRYKVDDIVAKPATTLTVDPRLAVMYNKVKNLIGINESSSELISMLQTKHRGGVPDMKIKIVSVVGVGGLGKTTLAKAVFDKLRGDFDHKAFVPVGRNPDLKKIIKAILIELDKERYMQFNFTQLDEIYQFINELRDFLLKNKRFFIVVDDIWEVESWEKIKLAIDDDDNDCEGRIIVTTRKMDVATKAGEVYKLKPLSDDSSRELFYKRMYGDEVSLVDNQHNEITGKILKRCGGIPLAIISMASLLVEKPRDKWSEIYKTIGFGSKDSKGAENAAMKILSFSYYDLPSHLRTCLLYLSAYPEDSFIPKRSLIWKWVAEGFIVKDQGTWIFETGEGYFNDLVNRSLIQAEEVDWEGIVTGCRVHDIVLDLIRSMSHNENFFTVQDNDDQDTPLQGHVRRLAHLNGTMQHTRKADDFDVMRTVRSFSAQECAIESWVPLSSFTLLRVLAIEDCMLADGCQMRMKFVGKLLHLRYFSLSGTTVYRVPEEIGGLRFLETLDLSKSKVRETPSSSSMPTQLVCLRISFDYLVIRDNRVDWIERMTSLEELYIEDRFQWKELGCLRELRVLDAGVFDEDDECEGHFVEAVSHLDKLQNLSIKCVRGWVMWQAVGLALPRQLRDFCMYHVTFLKLPPCISPWGLPNLCHLDLRLKDMDEQDLKSLGGLPELRFLRLNLYFSSSAAISNIIDDNNNAVYFPNLRHFKLPKSTVLFVANKEDNKSVSFHVLGRSSTYHECMGSAAAGAASIDDENNKEEEEDANVGRKGVAAPRPRCCFMPSLQELEFRMWGHLRRYCDDSLGWEYLPSLREVDVDIVLLGSDDADARVKVEKKLRSEADAHPNHPAALMHLPKEAEGYVPRFLSHTDACASPPCQPPCRHRRLLSLPATPPLPPPPRQRLSLPAAIASFPTPSRHRAYSSPRHLLSPPAPPLPPSAGGARGPPLDPPRWRFWVRLLSLPKAPSLPPPPVGGACASLQIRRDRCRIRLLRADKSGARRPLAMKVACAVVGAPDGLLASTVLSSSPSPRSTPHPPMGGCSRRRCPAPRHTKARLRGSDSTPPLKAAGAAAPLASFTDGLGYVRHRPVPCSSVEARMPTHNQAIATLLQLGDHHLLQE